MEMIHKFSSCPLQCVFYVISFGQSVFVASELFTVCLPFFSSFTMQLSIFSPLLHLCTVFSSFLNSINHKDLENSNLIMSFHLHKA